MKGRLIILDHIGEIEAAAYLVDGKLDDILIEDTDAPRPGAIYRGVIPFIIIQLLVLGALWRWPELATWLPDYVYG